MPLLGTLRRTLHSKGAQSALTLAGILINLSGFLVVYWQMGMQVDAIRSDVSASLTELSYEPLRFMGDRPSLYPYFYESKPLLPDDPHRVEVLICCEMIANYCDNVMQQRTSMSEPAFESWKTFVLEQCLTSPSLREFVIKYEHWYSAELGDLARRASTRPTN